MNFHKEKSVDKGSLIKSIVLSCGLDLRISSSRNALVRAAVCRIHNSHYTECYWTVCHHCQWLFV